MRTGWAEWQRIIALLLAFSISGGMLIFPRNAILGVLLVWCLATLGPKIKIKPSRLIIYLFILSVVLLSFIYPGPYNGWSTISRFLHFTAALLILEIYIAAPPGALHSDLFKILRIMAIQTLITAVLGNLVPQIFSSIDINGQHYKTILLIFNFPDDRFSGLARPNGMFHEPGVLQIYLSLLLYLTLFIRRNLSWSVVTILAVLSTWSTIGLAIATILLALVGIQASTRLTGARRVAVVTFMAVAFPVVAVLALQNFQTKTTGDLRSSYVARHYDMRTGLNIVREHPFFGIGFGLDRYLEKNALLGFQDPELTRAQALERPNSNGLLQALYTLGLPLGLLFIFGLIGQNLFPHRIAISAILLLSFYGQSILFTPFFTFIIFSAFVPKRLLARQRLFRRGA